MRKRLKIVIVFLLNGILFIGMSSCEKKDDCCPIVDVDVQIYYKNESGDNLINSVYEYQESNIKIYYKNGDAFEYVYNANLDYPNMHHVDTNGNGNLLLTVYPSNYYEGNQSTTLIELNSNVRDTLVCEFELDSNREICKRAWLNGVEMSNRYIEIEK